MGKNTEIFNKKIIVKNIENYNFGDLSNKFEIIKKWIEFAESGVLDKTKETALQTDFLNDFFGEILGYKNTLDSSEEWTLDKETKTKADETRADGALGYFNQNGKNIKAVIELKDSKTKLDERQTRLNDRRTPIEQAFSYSFKSGKECNWVIVSNYKEIRFYNAKDSNEYEMFYIKNLKNEEELKRFIFLMCAENLISKEKESLLDILYRKNIEAEEEISKKFYNDYKKFRMNLFNHIKEKNPEINEILIFEKTQKLIDRFIFVCFCEDTGLLNEKTIRKLVEMARKRLSRSNTKIWSEMKDLFLAIDLGSPEHNINRFNGGLFAEDKIIDNFVVEDDIFEELALISDYDFASDLNVNILGHIFEQSLNDIEEIKSTLSGENFDEKKGKRKKDGIFYTPEYITKYIVKEAIGSWIEDRKKEFGFYELVELTEEDKKVKYKNKKSMERVFSENTLKHIEFWENYKEKLKNIKVLDPACGSGAFLNQAFDYLKVEGEKVNDELASLRGIYSFEDLSVGILKNNIFGVDLNEESVEITKLSLWLKTAKKTDPLTSLDNNIRCGNSLIDDENIAGEKAFKWEVEFKEIMDNGGFDVVIGNPPYEVMSEKETGIKDIKRILEYFENHEILKNSIKGKTNLYKVFICKAQSILKKEGFLGFIVPMALMGDSQASSVRKYLLENTQFIKFECFPQKDNPENRVFEQAKVSTVIFILKNQLLDNSFYVRIHQGKYIETPIEKALVINKKEVFEFDIENFAIPTCDFDDWKILKKIRSKSYFKKLGELATQYQGEINETNERVKGVLTKENNCPQILRGANITLYSVREASQGEQFWLDDIKYLENKKIDSKAFHHNYKRIGFQRSAPQNNFRRLIAAPIEKNYYCFDTVSYITEKSSKLDLDVLLLLLNSKFYDWYFRNISTNSKVNEYQFNNLPCFECEGEEINVDLEILLKEERYNEIIILFKKNIKENKKIAKWILSVMKSLSRKIQEIEKLRILKNRSERSKLDEKSMVFQRYVDLIIYMIYELDEDECKYIHNRLMEML